MNTQNVPAPGNNARQIGWQENWTYSAQTSLPSPVAAEAQPVQSGPKLAPLVYTIEEAAVVLNCSTKTIRRLIARQYLTCCTVLRKKLIPRKQIEDFLKATCETPKSR